MLCILCIAPLVGAGVAALVGLIMSACTGPTEEDATQNPDVSDPEDTDGDIDPYKDTYETVDDGESPTDTISDAKDADDADDADDAEIGSDSDAIAEIKEDIEDVLDLFETKDEDAESETSPEVSPEVSPDVQDADADIGTDVAPDVQEDADAEVPPDIKEEIDSGPPTIPGVSFIADLTGAAVDMDVAKDGVTVLVGSPASVYDCKLNDMGAAVCTQKANLSNLLSPGSVPVSYAYTTSASKYAVVNAANPLTGNPVDLFTIKDSGVIDKKTVSDLAIPGSYCEGSTLPESQCGLPPMGPRGLLSLHYPFSLPDGSEKTYFVSNGYDFSQKKYVKGLIFGHTDEGKRDVAVSLSINASGLALSKLNSQICEDNLDGSVLVLLNAGKIDTTDKFTAGLTVFNIVETGYPPENISFGEVEAEGLNEIPSDSTGKEFFVIIKKPDTKLAKVNIETKAVDYVPFAGTAGPFSDLVVNDTSAYIADQSGIIFIDLQNKQVLGKLALPDTVTTMSLSGGILYATMGKNLLAIDPAQVELQ